MSLTPLAKSLDLTLTLTRVADASGLSLSQARKLLGEIALLPREQGDALLAEARRERIRESNAQLRRQRRR